MKITDEIDAMRTMDFEPTLFLVMPRIFCISYFIAFISFFADIVGIFGGMVIAYTDLDVTFFEFINRMGQEVPVKHLLIGFLNLYFWNSYCNNWLLQRLSSTKQHYKYR